VNIESFETTYQITFDQYLVAPNFTYGPQPPNLNTSYTLIPSMDKEASDFGDSLFFYTFYDKLSICKLPRACQMDDFFANF